MVFFGRHHKQHRRQHQHGRHWGWQKRSCDRPGCLPPEFTESQESTLANVPPGERAIVAGFCERMNPERRAHLQAYGLVPGRAVQVVQQYPVTVLQVDHTELALEVELACGVKVIK